MADSIVVTARVTGRVQGVWFRGWTQAEAERRGLCGWVRNDPDGSVIALIGGPEAEVRAMIATLHTGPEAARVAEVEIVHLDSNTVDLPEGFNVRR